MGTWRNGYCVNTGHLKRCPHKQLKDAQKIFRLGGDSSQSRSGKAIYSGIIIVLSGGGRNELIDRNPFEGLSKDVKIPKASEDDTDIDPFTRDERQAIIEGFERSRYYQYYTSLVKFLFCIGCRPSYGFCLSFSKGQVSGYPQLSESRVDEGVG